MNYIVVPDGIAAYAHGQPCAKPSFVYAQVLDYAAQIYRSGDTLYLAPANASDSGTEHQLAHVYLLSKSSRFRIVCPDIVPDAYVDTYGNAVCLKDHLEENISTAEFEMICAYIHSCRAEYCFKKAGYRIGKIHRVHYRIYPEPICRRWWYYKYKPVHWVYEMLAFCRDLVKY